MVRRPPKLKAESTAVLFASVVLAALRRAARLIVARLLERDAELRQLSALARNAGRVVLMRGEAGVGKTAVIGELVAGADPAVRVLQGWCVGLADTLLGM
jgi:MoxR-like ATPase